MSDIYCGPYLVINFKPVKEIARVKQCPNGHQGSRGDYCFICGSKYTILNKETEKPGNLFNIIEESEHEDDFYMPEYVCGQGNNNVIVPNNSEYYVEIQIIELNGQVISEVIKKFKDEYKKQISFIKKKVDSVEIKFGVFGID